MRKRLALTTFGALALRLLGCSTFGTTDSGSPGTPDAAATDGSARDDGGDASPPSADAGADVRGSFTSNFDPPQLATSPFGWSKETKGPGGTIILTTVSPHSPPNALQVTAVNGDVAALTLDIPDGPTHMVLQARVRIDSLTSATGAIATIAEVGCSCDPPTCTPAHDVRGEVKVSTDAGATGKATDDTAADEHSLQTVPVGTWMDLTIEAKSSATANTYTMKLNGQTVTPQASGTCTSGRRAQIGVRYSSYPSPSGAGYTVSYDDVSVTWD